MPFPVAKMAPLGETHCSSNELLAHVSTRLVSQDEKQMLTLTTTVHTKIFPNTPTSRTMDKNNVPTVANSVL